jgi:2,3-bisphosphoglycerate-independent phosphoglycerate mutase
VVDVLVIPDGAAQPPRPGVPTALEQAYTPALDAVAAEGSLMRVATTPTGLPAGSESGIPTLLGAAPDAPVGRGRVDAAGRGIAVPDDVIPWRADLVYRNGRRASIRQVRDVCAHLGSGAQPIGGHRVLLMSRSRPLDRRILGLHLRVWADGPAPAGPLPRPTTLICAAGTAAGCGRLLGADVVTPDGTTGDVDTDLDAKLRAAAQAVASEVPLVVVHVGGPDEAAHRREQESVISALERIDSQLVGPLFAIVERRGGRLAVCPDHGTDPVTGVHDPAPVPAVVWPRLRHADGGESFDERAACAAPLFESAELLAGMPV